MEEVEVEKALHDVRSGAANAEQAELVLLARCDRIIRGVAHHWREWIEFEDAEQAARLGAISTIRDERVTAEVFFKAVKSRAHHCCRELAVGGLTLTANKNVWTKKRSMSPATAQAAADASRRAVNLSDVVDQVELQHAVYDDHDVEEDQQVEIRNGIAAWMLTSLNDDQRAVVMSLYGLGDDGRSATEEELAEETGRSVVDIRRVHHLALQAMRKAATQGAPAEYEISEAARHQVDRLASLTYSCTACGAAVAVAALASGTGSPRRAIEGKRQRCKKCR